MSFDGVPQVLGKYDVWSDAMGTVFDAVDRKNLVIVESSNDSHHTFRFNDDGMVVFVDHFCNEKQCKYNDLKLLNK